MFALVVAGMTWHSINPAAGTSVAARTLHSDGRLAVFWNIARLPPQLAAAFADVYQRVAPDMPFASMPTDPLAGYQPILSATTDTIRATDSFAEPQRHDIDWERPYATDEWPAQVPTFGGHSRLLASQLAQLLDGIADAIEDAGGSPSGSPPAPHRSETPPDLEIFSSLVEGMSVAFVHAYTNPRTLPL